MTLDSLLSAALTATSEAGKEATFWMPPQASTLSPDVDHIFYVIYWASVLAFVLTMAAMTYFALRYRRKSDDQRTTDLHGNAILEVTWSVIPAIFLVVIFVMGFQTYMDSTVPPANAVNVRVTGAQWSWAFAYPDDGIQGVTEMVVPAGKPVKLTMSSVDVIHSFFVPDFRIKKDVLPNRYTVLWFEAPAVGEHIVYCTEYCGQAHSKMLTKIKVVAPEEYKEWISTGGGTAATDKDPVEWGKELATAQACATCHSADGTKLVGPSFKGIYGKMETLADGTTVKVDDNYLRESLMKPGDKIVQGFAPVMPTYSGRLNDAQVDAIIDYIKSLAEQE